jgi:aldose 1-epimerase
VTGSAIATLHELHSGYGVSAVVSEQGASLRSLIVDGVELVRGTLDAESPFAAGIVLVPWPNRVADGQWLLDGKVRQLELTEPELGNANHGLLASTRYKAISSDAGGVILAAPIASSRGYPFDLATSVEYRVVEKGIRVRHQLTNLSPARAPVAIGTHPYLRLGDVPIDELVLTLSATRAFRLDERHIPRGSFEVAGTDFDLRAGRPVGEAVDHACFADLAVHDGEVTHRLAAPDGRAVELWAEAAFAYAQVYVTREFPGPTGPEVAIAVEPMTAPPNALQSGEGLRWLRPGQTWGASWGIRLID